MSRRLLPGLLILASSLATVGAAVSSGSRVETTNQDASAVIASREVTAGDATLSQPSQARAQVPLRSGRLAGDTLEQTGPTPVSVRIADIDLEAPVLAVGVDDQNRFAVPAADTVGWYRYGSRPGDDGATVLAAHVDYGGRPGAFFNLASLRPGDPLELEMSDGRILRYRVTGNTQYDKTALPAEELFRKDGEPVLQLITCGGSFDPAARSYTANVVVTAVPQRTI